MNPKRRPPGANDTVTSENSPNSENINVLATVPAEKQCLQQEAAKFAVEETTVDAYLLKTSQFSDSTLLLMLAGAVLKSCAELTRRNSQFSWNSIESPWNLQENYNKPHFCCPGFLYHNSLFGKWPILGVFLLYGPAHTSWNVTRHAWRQRWSTRTREFTLHLKLSCKRSAAQSRDFLNSQCDCISSLGNDGGQTVIN